MKNIQKRHYCYFSRIEAQKTLRKCKTYSEEFIAFKNTSYYKSSQAEQILSNIQQYYTGKRGGKDLRDAKRDEFDDENISNSDEEGRSEYHEKTSENEIPISDAMESCIE